MTRIQSASGTLLVALLTAMLCANVASAVGIAYTVPPLDPNAPPYVTQFVVEIGMQREQLRLAPQVVTSTPEEVAKGWPAQFWGTRLDVPSGVPWSALAIYTDANGDEKRTGWATPLPVPEPSMVLGLACGVALLWGTRRR